MTGVPPPLPSDAALFLDVDGTLLEIAPRPELVEVPRQLPALLVQLAEQRQGALALVSGRTIADLDRLLEPWRGAAAGLHGGEMRHPDGSRATAAATDMPELDRIRPLAVEFASNRPGVLFEDKGGTLAVHYRGAPQYAEELRQFAEAQVGAGNSRLRLIAGKMVFELAPSHHGKDRAVFRFLLEAPFRGRVPVFLGDDTTDEDGFAEVNRRGGLSIRVGPPADLTAAAYILPSVAAVLAWLQGKAPQ